MGSGGRGYPTKGRWTNEAVCDKNKGQHVFIQMS